MSFFQNPTDQEFRGNWVLGDRQYVVEFVVPPNRNTSNYMLAYNSEPYNFSTNNTLTINYAYDDSLKNYSALSINVAGSSPATTKATEVIALLNANVTFSDMFLATVYNNPSNLSVTENSVLIRNKTGRAKINVRAYISSSSAERMMQFNKHAPVVELPLYMDRHTIANRFTFTDSLGILRLLDTAVAVDQAIITEAGFDYTSPKADWELLQGRGSGLFMFSKMTVDGIGRPIQIVEYGAGSVVGGFSRLTTMSYTGINSTPDQITEEPYTLTSGDLVTP